jgi:hypothetical protein
MESAILFMGGLREVPDVAKSQAMDMYGAMVRLLEQHSVLKINETLFNRNVSKRNVVDKMGQIAHFLAEGENRIAFVYYFGHGNQIRDLNGDEEDGMDEYWALYGGGRMLDDDISYLFNTISPKNKLILWSDSCSSGTMIDIKLNSKNWITYTSCKDCQDSYTTFDGGVATIWGFAPLLTKNYMPDEYYAALMKRLSIVGQTLQYNYGNKEVISEPWFRT